MRKLLENKRNRIIAIAAGAVILIAVIAAGIYFTGGGSGSEKAHVATVASVTGTLENGMRNRYPGVVESVDSWSAKYDSTREIKKFYVKVGDEVKKGDKLFVYDTTEAEESLASEKLELRRLQDELTALNDDAKELQQQKNEAGDQTTAAELTVEIQQKQLDVRSKNYEIESKKKEIKKTTDSIGNSTVKSKIKGVVKSINDGTTDVESADAITIVNTKSFRVKARVNELNLASLSENTPVIVFSRVSNDVHWKGTISKIDNQNAAKDSAEEEAGDEMTASSSYYFYITLEGFKGMTMGQHVYVEEDVGQLSSVNAKHIELDDFYIVDADKDSPYVWAAKSNGRLEKRRVKLGKHNEETGKYVVENGLELTDLIAVPDESLREGMKTVDENAEEEVEEESSEDGEDADAENFDVEDGEETEDAESLDVDASDNDMDIVD